MYNKSNYITTGTGTTGTTQHNQKKVKFSTWNEVIFFNLMDNLVYDELYWRNDENNLCKIELQRHIIKYVNQYGVQILYGRSKDAIVSLVYNLID